MISNWRGSVSGHPPPGLRRDGPNFQTKVDGWVLTGSGYRLWEFVLSLDESNATDKHWHLKLALMRMPKAQLR
jgi:hypothetical protein